MAQMPNRTGNQSKHVPPQPAQVGLHQKVSVCKPKDTTAQKNDGYRSSSYLK
jgi:hypothetical protein